MLRSQVLRTVGSEDGGGLVVLVVEGGLDIFERQGGGRGTVWWRAWDSLVESLAGGLGERGEIWFLVSKIREEG